MELDETISSPASNFLLNGTFDPITYQLFFDFEMTGIHKETTPISVGIISNNGKTFYAEFSDFDRNQVDEWVADNVIAKTKYIKENVAHTYEETEHSVSMYYDTANIRSALNAWLHANFHTHYTEDAELSNRIEFIGDCCAYDWMLLTDLLGTYEEEPLISTKVFIDMESVPHPTAFQTTKEVMDYLKLISVGNYIQTGLRKIGLPTYPAGINYIPTDICTMFKDRNIDADINREEFAGKFLGSEGEEVGEDNKHNSLWDARVIRACHKKLKALDLRLSWERIGENRNLRWMETGDYEDSSGNIFRLEFVKISDSPE